MRFFLLLLLGVFSLAQAEMHVVLSTPLLTEKSEKGEQVELTTAMPATDVVVDQKTKEVILATVKSTEYHIMVKDDFDYKTAGAIYVAMWDQKSPYIVLLLGDPATIHMMYAGWPTETKEQYEARMAAQK